MRPVAQLADPKSYRHGAGNKRIHIAVAEKALGREIPKGAEVHHSDGNRNNNLNENLVICPSRSYHFLLHRRMKAQRACGNPNWLECRICHSFDDPENVSTYYAKHGTPVSYHKKCAAQEYHRQRKNVSRN